MQRPRSKNYTQAFRTLRLSVVLIVCFIGVFLCSFTSQAAEVDFQRSSNYVEHDLIDNLAQGLRFNTSYGQIVSTWDADSFNKITNRKMSTALDGRSGVVVTPGTFNSVNGVLLYPFSGAYSFPSVNGHVDHRELTVQFTVLQSLSANMARAAGVSDVYKYQPFLSVQRLQLQYCSTSGSLSSFNVYPDEFSYLLSITQGEYTSTYTPNDINVWNDYTGSSPVTCSLTYSFEEFPSDFAYFTGADIYFDSGVYYTNTVNDIAFYQVRPDFVRLTTVWLTNEDYAAIQKEEEFRNDLTVPSSDVASDVSDFEDSVDSALQDIKDQEQSWQDSVDAIYESYGVDPDSMAGLFDNVVADLRLEVSSIWLTQLWNFFKDYKFLYLFLNSGLVFCMIVFLLRR